MNIWDILLVILLAVILIAALTFSIRKRKQGGCGCGCAGCDGTNCPSSRRPDRPDQRQ